MKGSPPLVDQHLSPRPATQWTAGLGALLRGAEVVAAPPTELTAPLELRLTSTCLWFIFSLGRTERLGLRVGFDPLGLRGLKLRARDDGAAGFHLSATGGFGTYEVDFHVLEADEPFVRLRVWLTPADDTRLEGLPRDLCMLDGRFEPSSTPARLLTSQVGRAAGHLYVHVPGEPGACFFCFENFAALRSYVEVTKSVLWDAVKAEWPDCGFSLPAGPDSLPAGKKMQIRDTFLRLRPGLPEGEAGAGEWFIASLANVYAQLPRVESRWHDWPDLATRSLRTLQRAPACRRVIGGKSYFQAYVDGASKPPESMVQGAIIVPMIEFEEWRGREIPALKDFAHFPASFFDAEIRCPVRWLPGTGFDKDELSEEEQHFRMDSWYLLHTLCNIGRLAEFDRAHARDIFMGSLDTLVRTARHFGYDWPIFYDQRNLRVAKPEKHPGQGGEQDANGLYIHLMLQAYSLTHEARYLEEAEAAAEKLRGLLFGVLYQTNNTAFGAVALARLWRTTRNRIHRDLSVAAIGSVLSHLWLWDLGPETVTFMGLPPLHDAPYTAFYEEAEVLSALQAWLVEMGDDAPDGARLLIGEYVRHLLGRAHFYYPSELPPESLAEAKEGPIRRRLFVPLEGLGGPGEKHGTVGQAVYACGAPFILATRAWHRPKAAPFTLACNHPLLHIDYEGSPRRGAVRLHLAGSPRATCELRLWPRGRRRLPEVRLRTREGAVIPWEKDRVSPRVASVPGDARLLLDWGG